MPALAEVAREKLQMLASAARRRSLIATARDADAIVTRGGKPLISFSCNDYLGLSQHAAVKEAAFHAIETCGTGAGASRLVTGNHPLYSGLEAKLAAWKGTESALIFGSGYLANSGIVPALTGKGDIIIADKSVHACLIDGAQLSGAKLVRFKHNDAADCERLLSAFRTHYRHCLIITEDVFSMDGDRAPLMDLKACAKRHDAWLMVDGAHSITPPEVSVDMYVGTLSKALGAYGGYVCAQKTVIDYLATSVRSFIFSTGLPPAVIASASAALDIINADPALAATPVMKARVFTHALSLPEAQSQIVPIVLGDEAKALAAARELEEAGYLVVAIRPPTVPVGSSRLRFAFSALHTDADILRLAAIIKDKGWV